MNTLVGKVLTLKSEKTNHIVTSLHSDSTVHVAGAGTYGAKELWSYFTIDGQPCAVEE